jgi:hypothetical protein
MILPIGVVLFIAFGFCLDRLRAKRAVFLTLNLAVAIGFFYCCALAPLGSLERVQSKYSILGFAGLSCNIGLCAAVLISFMTSACLWLWRMTRRFKRSSDAADQEEQKLR